MTLTFKGRCDSRVVKGHTEGDVSVQSTVVRACHIPRVSFCSTVRILVINTFTFHYCHQSSVREKKCHFYLKRVLRQCSGLYAFQRKGVARKGVTTAYIELLSCRSWCLVGVVSGFLLMHGILPHR